MSKWVMLAIIVVLVVGLAGCGVASFFGLGVQQIGARHLRAGSVYGPSVSGGGPSAGK